MSKEETVVDQLVAAINRAQSWNASLLNLVLLQEFRHWEGVVNAAPQAAGLDRDARVRVAAKSTVDIVLTYFHDENRADLQKVRDELIERLVTWAAKPPELPMILN